MAKTQAEVRAAKDAALAKHDNNKSSPTHQNSRSKIGQQTISAASSRSNTASYSGSSGSMSNGKFTVTGPIQRYSSAPTQEEKTSARTITLKIITVIKHVLSAKTHMTAKLLIAPAIHLWTG